MALPALFTMSRRAENWGLAGESYGDGLLTSPQGPDEIFPRPMQHAVRVNDRRRLQAGTRDLWLCFLGRCHRASSSLLRLDLLADRRIVLVVLPVAPHVVGRR